MSRAAVAQSHRTLRTPTFAPPVSPTGGVRLLGHGQAAIARRNTPLDGSPAKLAASKRQALVWDQMAFEPYYPALANPASRSRLQIKHPVWLLGTIFGLVALMVVVTPVLARSKHSTSGSGLRAHLNGSLLTPPQPGAADAPVVDATAPQLPGSDGVPAAPPAGAGSEYTVLGPPSLSVAQIEAVLQEYASPAAGLGQSLHNLGLRYGIDPAYALAFFVHESACGTKGVARFSRSLGNIRWTPGYESYEGYRAYTSWEAGFEDWYRLITDLYINGWGLRTVDDIIPVYAPYGDNNDPPTYVASVKSLVDSWRGK